MILCNTSFTRFQKLDGAVRRLVKDILHLHPSTTDHVLYARKRDEGLGLPRLAHTVKLAVLKSGMTLLASGDVTVRALAELVDL